MSHFILSPKHYFLLTVFISFIGVNSHYAANLSGVYTVGAGGSYTNLTAVASALNNSGNTVTGNVVFELTSAYSGSETLPVIFNAYNTSNPSYTVTIRPASGVSSVLTSGSSNSNVFRLNGVKNLYFDGRAGGSGSSVWTIRNTRTSSTYGTVFTLQNGACDNILRYLILESSNVSNTGNINIASTTGTSGNNNNLITNCVIRNRSDVSPSYLTVGINASGSTSYPNTGNTISNCEIHSVFSPTASTTAILIGTGNTGFTISDNKIFQPASLTFTAAQVHYGIRLNWASGHGFTISGNTIGYATSSGTGTYVLSGSIGTRFIPVSLTVGAASASSVQGNLISNIELSTTSVTNSGAGVFTGIYVTSGKVNIGDVTSNTIGSTSSTGAISIELLDSVTTASAVNGIYVSSTDTCVISSNIISGINVFATQDIRTPYFYGIYTLGTGGNMTISENLIGSNSTANSILVGNTSTSASGRLYAIINSATGSVSISNNTISYCKLRSTGTSTYFRGINVTAGIAAITENTLKNLESNSGRTNAGSGAGLIGISNSSTAAQSRSINQNEIYNLINSNSTANVHVTGIYWDASVSGSNTLNLNTLYEIYTSSSGTSSRITGIYYNSGNANVERNFVKSLSVSGSNAQIYGIHHAGGGVNFYNNMFRLGIDHNGDAITEPVLIYAIYKASTTASLFYHNSIFIGGSGVGSGSINTYGFYRSNMSVFDEVINNIFSNVRSNSSGTAKHYAYVLYNVNAITMNYNLYNASGTGGVLASVNNGGTDRASIKALRENFTGQELNSGYGDPSFSNPSGNSSSVSLSITGTSPAEAAGTSLAQVSEDFSGDTRSSLSPVDIGADAGNFTASDVFTPNFSFTPLSNTTSTSNRTLSNVQITDIGQGVISTSNKPRVWYRRSSPSASAWVSNEGNRTSGTDNNGIWEFTLDYSLISGGVASGNTIQYYIVAQDAASSPNIWYSPFAGASHSNVATQTSAPTTPLSYVISSSGLSGNYTVGSGGDYPTLTGTGGFFADVNAKQVLGNITLSIIGDITETGANVLNEFSEDPSGSNYTITIKPNAASTRTLSGSRNGYLFQLYGADRIIFDGSFEGSGSYLVFSNNSTNSAASVFELTNSAVDNIIRNCTIQSSAGRGVYFTLGNSTSGNNENLIENCVITNGSAGRPQSGIESYQSTVTVGRENKNNTITGCHISNTTTYGIFLNNNGNGERWVFTDNHFYYNHATTQSSASYGIYVSSTACDSLDITGNYIGGSSSSCGGSAWLNDNNSTSYGIYLLLKTDGSWTTIDNNTIQNIRKSNAGASGFQGITVAGGKAYIGTTHGNLIGHASNASSIRVDGTVTSYGIYGSGRYSRLEVNKNTIANFSQHNTGTISFYGIALIGDYSVSVTQNKLINSGPAVNSSAGTVAGIHTALVYSLSATYTIANNIISLGQGVTNNCTYRGISLGSASNNTMNVYYNTVLIGGSSNGSNITDALYKGGANAVVVKNNLLFNSRGGTAAGYALTYNNTTSVSSDYNFMISSVSNPARWGSTAYSLVNYKTTSAKDASSWANNSVDFAASSLFEDVSEGNLHIQTDNPECWSINGAGDPVSGQSSDFEGNARNTSRAAGPVDIGAYEFTPLGSNDPSDIVASEPIAVGNACIYWHNGRIVAKIVWKAGTDLPSALTVKYFSGDQPDDAPSGDNGYAWFEITPIGGTNFTYDLLLYFDAAVLGSISSERKLHVSKNSGSGWAKVPDASYSEIVRYLMLSDQTSFSRFLFIEDDDDNIALPVSLVSFTARKNNSGIDVSWVTNSELNAERYDLLHSTNLNDFSHVASIPAAGNSNTINSYSYRHYAPIIGVNYYSLIQFDFDGKSVNYGPVAVRFNEESKGINAWFDERGLLNISDLGESAYVTLTLLDVYGRSCLNTKCYLNQHNTISIDNLSKGIYFLNVFNGIDTQTIKLVKY